MVLLVFEVFVVELLAQRCRTVIVEFTSAMNLVLIPHSLIGQLARVIIYFAVSVHFVIFPITFVVPSLQVIKCS